jgi:hypothetical protein
MASEQYSSPRAVYIFFVLLKVFPVDLLMKFSRTATTSESNQRRNVCREYFRADPRPAITKARSSQNCAILLSCAAISDLFG